MSMRVDLEVEELATAAAGGEDAALEALYRRYADQVLRFVRLRIGHDLLAAEDVASTTWERVARNIRDYQTRGSGFPAWLFTIAKRTTLEHHRCAGRRRREELDAEFLADEYAGDGSTHELVEARLRSTQIAEAVRSLSKRQRECVTYRFFVGLSLSDTAAVMNLKTNAVKQLQYRALGTLADRFGGVRPVGDSTTMVAAADMLTAQPGEKR